MGAGPVDRMPGVEFGAAHLGSRDRFIGWSQEARRRNIRFIAYNTRFLILPWVCIENLASHILGRMVARIKRFKNHTVQASQFLQKLAKEGVDLFVHWRIVVAGTFA
jgi:hypothetical protein